MSLHIGMVGIGSFAQSFIPLFKAHPLVERVILCDLDKEKLQQNCENHGISESCASLDDLCGMDIDAAVIITQNWLHAPQAAQALRAGKHVYSAVPTGIRMEEIEDLVKAVEKTGKAYMIGETSTYYPGVIYCRERFQGGDFGHIVYGEAEYYHDWDHGLYEVMKRRGGKDWKKYAGGSPMHYPTHSTSQIISVTGAHMTHVSCQGFVDTGDDGLYKKGGNIWDNEFSNESALFKMSDGSMCRINEFRRIGHPGTVRMALWGTEGSFESNRAGSIWLTRNDNESIRLDDVLSCSGPPAKKTGEKKAMDVVTSEDGTHLSVSSVHPIERLPKEFIGLPNGHAGSHQFLVDDFVRACAENRQPEMNHIWDAARYAIPGIIAHESAKRGGELMKVPDFGRAPF